MIKWFPCMKIFLEFVNWFVLLAERRNNSKVTSIIAASAIIMLP